MNESKNVPKIRLKEFDAEWSSSTLGDEGTFYYGRSCPKWSVTKDAIIPCIRYGELYTKFGTKIDKVYSYTNISPDNLRFSNGSEVLIPRVGEDPKDYNHCTWLSIPNVAIGEMISVYNTKNNPLFTSIMLNATMQDEFAKRVEGGSVTNLYYEKLKNIKVFFPSKLEQEKIGNYFENLDSLISLQNQKYEKLLNLKKSLLYKLFPKEGETVPELRFEGFSGKWEKKKLGNCFSERTESYPEGELLSVTINQGIKKFSELDRKNNSNDNKSKYKKVYVGDIAYNSMRMWQGASGYSEYEGIVSPAYTVLSPNDVIDSKCFSYLFKRTDIIHMFQIYSKGITSDNWNLKYPDFKELEVYVSQNYNEQKAIGQYFSKLDKLIELNKEKLEKLKNVKESLLDKMFV